MGVFQAKKFRSSSYNNTVPAKYRAALARHPFALFGLPFIATMVLGSFFLTPATALRYERHDRKVRQLTKEEELGIGKDRRRIDLKEEYYVSASEVRCMAREGLVLINGYSDWLPKILITGSRNVSSDYLASTTEFFDQWVDSGHEN